MPTVLVPAALPMVPPTTAGMSWSAPALFCESANDRFTERALLMLAPIAAALALYNIGRLKLPRITGAAALPGTTVVGATPLALKFIVMPTSTDGASRTSDVVSELLTPLTKVRAVVDGRAMAKVPPVPVLIVPLLVQVVPVPLIKSVSDSEPPSTATPIVPL